MVNFMDDSSCIIYILQLHNCTAIYKMQRQVGCLTFNVLLVYMWKPNPSGPLSIVTSLRPFKIVAPPLSPLDDMSDHRTLSLDFEVAPAEYSR